MVSTALPASAAGTSVELTSVSTTVGGSATIEVWVKGVSSPRLGAWDFTVDWQANKTKLTLNSVTGISPFTSVTTGPTGYPGYVNFNSFQSSIPGPSGDVKVANLNFTANSTGTIPLAISINTISDAQGDDIIATIVNGSITVGAAPFTTVTKNLAVSNQATFNSYQTGSVPQAPVTIAKIVARLTGSSNVGDTYTITLHFNTLSAGDDAEFSEAATASQTFWRGNAKPDSAINITDALYIAQYLANTRSISTINPLNAASIRPDGASGDKITITDALWLAQRLANIRDANFNTVTP